MFCKTNKYKKKLNRRWYPSSSTTGTDNWIIINIDTTATDVDLNGQRYFRFDRDYHNWYFNERNAEKTVEDGIDA